MRKIVCIIVSVIMIFSTFAVNGQSTTDAKMAEALKSVKERIGNTDIYTDFSSNMRENGESVYYSFDWSEYTDDASSSLSVTVDNRGIITSYHKWNDSLNKTEEKASLNTPKTDVAKKIAEDFIKRTNPQIAADLVLTPASVYEPLYSGTVSFRIQRHHKGIPVMGDSGSVSVSSIANEVTSFNINYTHLQFQEDGTAISRDEAVSAYNENIGLELKYIYQYKKDSPQKVKLVYVPKENANVYIDALTGEKVSVNLYRTFSSGGGASADKESMMEDSALNGTITFSQAEKNELANVAGLMSKEELTELIYNNKFIPVDSSYKLQYSNLYKSGTDEEKYTYSFSFVREEEDKAFWADVSIDAKSGQVLSYYGSWGYDEADEKKLTYDEAVKKADEAIKNLAPGYTEGNEYKQNEIADNLKTNATVSYTRYPNEVEYSRNIISATVSVTTGELTSFNFRHDDYEFPSPEKALNSQDANTRLFEQVDYEVWYVSGIDKDNPSLAKRVYYAPNHTLQTDAFTGELTYEWDEDKPIKYSDISNHYAENEIKALANHGVGFEGEEFMPDIPIKQKDFVLLVNSIFLQNSSVIVLKEHDHTYAYSNAQRRGVIGKDEYSPDQLVTRSFAVKMLIRAMGLEEAAKCKDIFIPLYNDVKEDLGYTSILTAMGVIKGDEIGNFNPDHTLTRADSAIMLYNYLTR